MEKKSLVRTIIFYTVVGLTILFLFLNRQLIQPKLIFFDAPSLPLGVWLFLMLVLGFFLGRILPKKKKIKA